MKKITAALVLMLALSTSLFAQKATYCDSITAEFTTTISGGKVTFAVKTSQTPITHEWSFGDGTNSKDLNPTHEYKSGSFTPCVYLTFKNIRDPKNPCVKKVCKSITISDPCGKFNPEFTYSVGNDGVVTFEASSSGSSTAYTYKWDFGDNTSSTDRVVKHTYKSGIYKVCVTITDPVSKCTKVVCKEVTVKGNCDNFKPTADITIDKDGVATFEASAGTNYTYKWDFGDNTTSTDRVGKHTYKTGSYKVCVTITDPATKCTITLCKELTYSGSDPCKDFNPKFEYKIGENGVVSFWGGNSGNTLTYFWNYGDGTSGTWMQTTHTYKPGKYKVCASIYDEKLRCKKDVCIEFEIKETNTDPCKSFNPEFGYKVDGNVVVFEGKSAPSGTTYTYSWTFSNNQSSKDRIVKVDFKKPGTYKACVTITDPKTKCTKTICKEIVIKGKATEDPCKDFNPKVSFQIAGNKVNLEVDGGKNATFEWSFGDGTKGSKDRKVSHEYSKPGKYNICVTAYDAKRNCKKTICFTLEVKGKDSDPCKNFNPSFTYKSVNGKVTVEGTNLSGVEYSWSWGDKQYSKGRVADHTYKTTGKYTICMVAYDPKTGCKKEICKTIEVNQRMEKPNEGDNTESLIVYPNPASNVISVTTLSNSEAKIIVRDVYGAEVIRYDATPNQNNTIDLMIESLPKGTYYINVFQDGKSDSQKFMK